MGDIVLPDYKESNYSDSEKTEPSSAVSVGGRGRDRDLLATLCVGIHDLAPAVPEPILGGSLHPKHRHASSTSACWTPDATDGLSGSRKPFDPVMLATGTSLLDVVQPMKKEGCGTMHSSPNLDFQLSTFVHDSDDEDSEANEYFGANDYEPEAEHLRPIAVDASKAEIVKALESCQLALGRALAENRSLLQKVSEFEVTAASKCRWGDGRDNRLGYKANVGPRARIFLLTREGWVTTADFRKGPPELSLDPAARFVNNTAYSHSVTAALFDVIPKKYHSLLDYAEYKHLGKDLHRVIVHGPSSLAANSKPDPKANGTRYGFVEVTHSLALAGTFARFLVSADKTFASIGAVTKMNWEADYCIQKTPCI
ncbi:hypothetical protein MVEN_02322000 [Mycena venus]|uniref:Uncharacterized protein n=1 Tax=Mycena venus TaxID=2733690 RepID=A0A8H6X522_9AGAR|nr:hypothetical protein MVEN_02322000 [Mycena venus]